MPKVLIWFTQLMKSLVVMLPLSFTQSTQLQHVKWVGGVETLAWTNLGFGFSFDVIGCFG